VKDCCFTLNEIMTMFALN